MRLTSSVVFGLLIIAVFTLASPVYANPTGAPLLTYPIEPCRILDTRISFGPLLHGTAINVRVRGAALDAADGAERPDCGVPPSAEAVIVNVVAVDPTAKGRALITWPILPALFNNGSINFAANENTSNEIVISLCNVTLHPTPHIPCPGPVAGEYVDFDIYVLLADPNGSTHFVADVVGYLAAP